MGGMVLNTQLKRTKCNQSTRRLGLSSSWVAQSLLCVVLGCGGLVATSWAQTPAGAIPADAIPADAMSDDATHDDPTPEVATPAVVVPQQTVELDAKLAGEPELAARQPEVSLADLNELSDAAQAVLAASAEAVVSMDGGSGIIISADGWVMTASHVCERPGRRIQVRLANGVQWPAQTFGVDLQKDTGMVKLLGDHVWPFVELNLKPKVEPGEWCVVMGYPWDAEKLTTPAVRLGRVTAVSGDQIVTDVPIIGGDSGGPVFSVSGELVAINSRIRLDVDQNIHVPVTTFIGQHDALTRAEFVRSAGYREKEPVDLSLTKQFGRDSIEIQRAVAGLVAKVEPSIVRIVPADLVKDDDRPLRKEVLGTIVSNSGLVVAKESDLQLPMKARVGEKWVTVELVSSDKKTDLALLQLMPEADMDFVSIQDVANPIDSEPVGQLILSVVKSSENAELESSLGTIMVQPQTFARTAARQAVDFGMVLDSVAAAGQRSKRAGLKISRVYPESIAAKAGLRNGDRLVSIDGTDVTDEKVLQRIAATVVGGQKVRFSIFRQGELLSFRVLLPERLPLVWDRWGGGPFSGRRFTFGTVIAHDSKIDPSDCGGPVIDLAGRFVGINVSRAMRTTTYAVPAKEIQRLVESYQQNQ